MSCSCWSEKEWKMPLARSVTPLRLSQFWFNTTKDVYEFGAPAPGKLLWFLNRSLVRNIEQRRVCRPPHKRLKFTSHWCSISPFLLVEVGIVEVHWDIFVIPGAVLLFVLRVNLEMDHRGETCSPQEPFWTAESIGGTTKSFRLKDEEQTFWRMFVLVFFFLTRWSRLSEIVSYRKRTEVCAMLLSRCIWKQHITQGVLPAVDPRLRESDWCPSNIQSSFCPMHQHPVSSIWTGIFTQGKFIFIDFWKAGLRCWVGKPESGQHI